MNNKNKIIKKPKIIINRPKQIQLQRSQQQLQHQNQNQNQNVVIARIPMRRLRDIRELKSEVKENIFRKAFEYSQFYNPNLREMRYPDSQILFQIRNNQIKQIITRFPRDTFTARSNTVRNYIDKIVKNPGFTINGDFIINLHDKSDVQPNVNELVFSKNGVTNKGLVPDIYAMENYRDVVDI